MEQPKLYMICGISGSGKTFYAKKLERQGVVRLSIDEELWPDFFILDPLLCAEHKAMLKEQAEARIKSRAANLIAAGRDVSIDMPFCKRAQRDEFRAFAREARCRGGARLPKGGFAAAQGAPCRQRGQKRPQRPACFRGGASAMLERL